MSFGRTNWTATAEPSGTGDGLTDVLMVLLLGVSFAIAMATYDQPQRDAAGAQVAAGSGGKASIRLTVSVDADALVLEAGGRRARVPATEVGAVVKDLVGPPDDPSRRRLGIGVAPGVPFRGVLAVHAAASAMGWQPSFGGAQ